MLLSRVVIVLVEMVAPLAPHTHPDLADFISVFVVVNIIVINIIDTSCRIPVATQPHPRIIAETFLLALFVSRYLYQQRISM
jgi:hypothetical protein